jgi:hypothetical protein
MGGYPDARPIIGQTMTSHRRRRYILGLALILGCAAGLLLADWSMPMLAPDMIVGVVFGQPGSSGFVICPQPGSGLRTAIPISVAITPQTQISDQRSGGRVPADWTVVQPGRRVAFQQSGGEGWATSMTPNQIIILDDGDLSDEPRCIVPSIAP